MRILRHREVKILARDHTASKSLRTGPPQSPDPSAALSLEGKPVGGQAAGRRFWGLQSPKAAPGSPFQQRKATPSVDSQGLLEALLRKDRLTRGKRAVISGLIE